MGEPRSRLPRENGTEMSSVVDQSNPADPPVGHETGLSSPSRLTLRRLGIDTYQEHIVYMRADCHVCRSEGFEARSRVRAAANGKRLPARLNVSRSGLLCREE